MLHSQSDYLERLLVVLEVIVGVLVYLVVLRVYLTLRPEEIGGYSDHLGILAFTTLIILGVRRMFRGNLRLRAQTVIDHTWNVSKIMILAFSVTVSALFLFDVEFVSRFVFVGFFAATTVALIALRVFFGWWYFSRAGSGRDNYLRVLIVGSGRRAHILAERLVNSPDWGVKIVGFLDPDDPEKYNRRVTDNVIGSVDEISEILSAEIVDEVIVAVPRGLLGSLQSIFDACEEEGVNLRFMADIYDFNAAKVRLSMIGKLPLLSFEPVAQSDALLVVKRLTDITLTLLSMPIMLPLFFFVAMAIRLDSKGPAFFTQERAGLRKRPFKMFKFRTMVVDAEARMADVEHLNEAEGPNFKIADDPRVTRLGRFLRRTSIDELPQLFNVLVGDMSLVGPRPMSLRDVGLFDRGIQRKRFSVRPGITCLWQVSGRSDLSFDDWLRLDLEYIDNWNLRLDFAILFKTIPAVLGSKGAV